MGGSKWVPPESVFGIKRPPKLKWGRMIEKPEDKFARKALETKMPKDSFHQIPRITYPQSPSYWRTYLPGEPFIQPRIVEQPDPASLEKKCMYRKKLEKAKIKSEKKKSEFLLSKFIKQARPPQKELYSWKEQLDPERIKVLIKYLDSPVELDQLYAAKALGRLGHCEEYVISALYNTLQECHNPALEYEVARSLALLGCLEACVVRVLIRYLKNENRREETLRALKISLQAWSKSEPTYIGACHSLTRNLELLVDLQDPVQNVSFNAAICLGYLDKHNRVAQEAMFTSLTKSDWKKKMQALVMLMKQMNMMNDVIIANILEQLQHSPVLKHRIDGTRMLIDIGLLTIQKEGFEEEVFDVLLEKLYEEPFLVVRQSVALTIEALDMKKQAWDIVEKQLKDENDEVRRRSVISLGVLGIRHKSVFYHMLEMLDLDTSDEVRVQIARTFASLGMNNTYVRKCLMDKTQSAGILASECTKALKTLDNVSAVQEELNIQPYKIH